MLAPASYLAKSNCSKVILEVTYLHQENIKVLDVNIQMAILLSSLCSTMNSQIKLIDLLCGHHQV